MRLTIYAGVIALPLFSATLGLAAPKEFPKPPMGDDLSVETWRGGSVRIDLKAYEARNNPLVYEIVREPRHGELSGFLQADENRQGFASVVYTHGDDEDSVEDEFTYKARAIPGGVSRAIKVKVRIRDRTPQLSAPLRVDFAAVAGESDARMIGLTNAGGKVLEGSVEAEEPFSVDGAGYFRLGRNQSTNIVMRFSPRSMAAVAQQKLRPAETDPSAVIVLNGEPREPFKAEAGPIGVLPDGAREGIIVVTNSSSSDLRLEVAARPEGFAGFPASVTIAAGDGAEIPLRIGADKKGSETNLTISISTEFHTQELPMTAPTVPPKLEVLTRELDFRGDKGIGSKEAELHVRNSGGVPGHFLLRLPKGIAAVDRAQDFTVAPDTDRQVLLSLQNNNSDSDADRVIVDLGKEGMREVPILLPEPKSESHPPTPSTPPTPTPTPAAMPWQLNEDVKLAKSDHDRPCILWLSAMGGWTNAVLQVVDANGARPYEPSAPEESWWRTLWRNFTGWLFGRAGDAQKAVAEQREFFENRLKVPEGSEEHAPESKQSEGEWLSREIATSDLGNPASRWRVVAQRDNSSAEPVSDDFQIDPANTALTAIAPTPTATPAPTQTPQVEQPTPRGGTTRSLKKVPHAQSIKLKAWSPALDGAKGVFQMPFDAQVRDYRFERMQRYFGPDPDTGYARVTYQGEPFAKDAVQMLERKATEAEGEKLDEVTVLFTGLPSGAEIYWRAIPLGADGSPGIPSETINFSTLSPRPFPWRSVVLGACILALCAVLYLRWKSRRTGY